MNKIFKIAGWVLGILGVIVAILGFSGKSGNVDLLLRYSYFLLIAAVAVWIILALVISGRNNPKSLLKAVIFIAIAAVLVFVVYSISKGGPAYNVRSQPSAGILKLSDTILTLSYILGIAAIAAIVFGAIKGAFTKN